MKIFVGSDHGGFELKQVLVKFLEGKNIDTVDVGTNSTESVDYAEFGHKVAVGVVKDADSKGIVICGSGIGISIAANKVKGARAALVHNVDTAKLTRQHNDANILALGGRVTTVEDAKKIVEAFLETEFEGGRHARRVEGIEYKND